MNEGMRRRSHELLAQATGELMFLSLSYGEESENTSGLVLI